MRKKLFVFFSMIFTLLLLVACGKKVEVTFDYGYDNKVEVVEVKVKDKVEKPADPQRDGYDFLGWYLDNEEYDFEKEVNEAFTLVANWENLGRKVTFDLGYEVVGKVTVVDALKGGKVAKPADPVRVGYKFLGWELADEAYDFDTLIDENITLVAKWEDLARKVTFDLGYEVVGKVTVVEALKGAKVIKPADPVRVGYKFLGWELADEAYDFDTLIDENITLVAKWEDLARKVTFDLDYEVAGKVTVVDVLKGEKVTKPADPVREDYVFLGWYLDATLYNFDTLIDGNITLVAKWERDELGAIAALKAHYADTINNQGYKVTEDLVLISKIKDLDITWTSSNPTYLANDGKVTRPIYAEGDKNVILTAKIGKQQAMFMVIVSKLDQTIEEKIEAALDIVTIVPSSSTGFQETNFDAVAKITIDGEEVAVVWETSDATVMTAKGVLVAFEDAPSKPVTLTATITYKEVTLSRDVNFLVKGVSEYENFSEALVVENNGEKVKVNGVALYGDIEGGYYLISSDGSIAYNHGARNKTEMPEGKLFDVMLTVDLYYSAFQIKNTSASNPRTGTLPVVVPPTMTFEQVAGMSVPSDKFPFNHYTFTLENVKVYVKKDASDVRYNTFIVKPDFNPETDIINRLNAVMIYYPSKIDALRALEGVQIDRIELAMNGYRTDLQVWYANFFDTGKDIDLTLTDAQKIAAAIEKLEGSIPFKAVKDGNVSLIDDFQGASIAWESSDETVIGLDGKITLPATAKKVTLTATVTSGEATDTLIREVWVGTPEELEVTPIATAAAYDGVFALMPFKVKGVVTGNSANSTYTIEDESGAFAVYTSSSVKLEVGYEYTIVGIRDLFNGLIQIKPISGIDVVKGVAKDLPNAVELKDIDIRNKEYIVTVQGHLVDIANAEVTKVVIDSYKNATITLKVGIAEIVLKYDSRVVISEDASTLLNSLEVGDVIDIVGAPLGWYNNPQLGYDNVSQIKLQQPETAQAAVEVIAAGLELPAVTNKDLTLPTSGRYETTISWESNNVAVIAADGKVTLPESNVNVKLTATVTKGEATVQKVFYVLVQVEEGVLNVKLARELKKDDLVTLRGFVTGISKDRYVYVSDEDGITINLYFIPAEMPKDVKVGDYVGVSGKIDVYNGLVQVKDGVIEVISSDNPIPDAITLDKIPEFTADDQGKRYSIDNLLVLSISTNKRTLTVTDGQKQFNIYSDMNVAEINAHLESAIGKVVNVVDIHLGWYNTPQFLIYDEAEVVINDSGELAKALLALSKLDLPNSITEAENLTFPETGEGLDIVWVSSHPEVISNTGVVVLPQDDVSVTITATITVDSKPYVKVFEIFVKAPVLSNKVSVVYDFTLLTEKTGVEMKTQADFLTMLAKTTTSDFMPIAVDNLAKIYEGNGSGGGEFENNPGVMKTGTSSSNGTMNLAYPKDIYSVEFTLRGWGKTDKVTLNGVTLNAPETVKELLFVLETSSKQLEFVFNDRALITKMVVTYLDDDGQGTDPDPKEEYTVTFDLNGGQGSIDPATVEDGEKVSKPTPDPIKKGYWFTGWNLGESPYDFSSAVVENLTLVAQWEAVDLSTIAVATGKSANTLVRFEGVVTGFTDYNTTYNSYDKVWLEDSTGAITVYAGKFPLGLAIGDKYEVMGKVAHYSGLIQIGQGSVLEFIDADNALITPIDISDIDDLTVSYMAKRVNLEGKVVSVNSTGRELVVEVDGKNITVRSNYSSAAHEVNAHLLTAKVGQEVLLKGIHVDWFNKAQLNPTLVSQVEFVPLTDQEKVNLAIAELETLYKNKTFNMDTTVTLLETSKLGVSISWALDPTDAIADGKWKVVTGDLDVTLTATLTIGEELEELILNVTIKYVEEQGGGEEPSEPIKTTLAYTKDDPTTNIDKVDNPTTTLGLDDKIFTVSSIKGSATNDVGFNKDGTIRLYFHANGGNTLVVAVKEGYEILEVKINFGNTVGNTKVVAGSFEETLTGDDYKNESYEKTDLAISQFSIQNVNGANVQVWISSIEITYQPKN